MVFGKQIKTIEDQGEKQFKALENLNQNNKQNQLSVNSIIRQELQLYLMILLTKEKAY